MMKRKRKRIKYKTLIIIGGSWIGDFSKTLIALNVDVEEDVDGITLRSLSLPNVCALLGLAEISVVNNKS